MEQSELTELFTAICSDLKLPNGTSEASQVLLVGECVNRYVNSQLRSQFGDKLIWIENGSNPLLPDLLMENVRVSKRRYKFAWIDTRYNSSKYSTNDPTKKLTKAITNDSDKLVNGEMQSFDELDEQIINHYRHLFALLRDVLADQVVAMIDHADELLAKSMPALGYSAGLSSIVVSANEQTKSVRFINDKACFDRNSYNIHSYNVASYKEPPDWLSPKNWANPELWDKKRW